MTPIAFFLFCDSATSRPSATYVDRVFSRGKSYDMEATQYRFSRDGILVLYTSWQTGVKVTLISNLVCASVYAPRTKIELARWRIPPSDTDLVLITMLLAGISFDD